MCNDKPNEKRKCQQKHFLKRMNQRYWLKLNRVSYLNIVEAIQSGKRVLVDYGNGVKLNTVASFRAKQSNRLSVWALVLDGIDETIPVIYDNVRKSLVTTHPELLKSEKNLT